MDRKIPDDVIEYINIFSFSNIMQLQSGNMITRPKLRSQKYLKTNQGRILSYTKLCARNLVNFIHS